MEYLEASGRLSGVRAARRAAREPFWEKTKPAWPTAVRGSKVWCRERDLNPHNSSLLEDFKSSASADSAIPAIF